MLGEAGTFPPFSLLPKDSANMGFQVPISPECPIPLVWFYSQCWATQNKYLLPLRLQNGGLVGVWQTEGKGKLHPLVLGWSFY